MYEQECLALLNTALNRIASPYCSDSRLNNINYEEMGITKDIGLEKNDGPDGTYVWEFTGTPESDPKKERIDIDKLINLALKGSDKTKEGTILGATKYAKVWTKEDKDENTKTVDDVLSSYKLKQGIGGGGFYISDEEYVHYQKYYINNKIKSVFMQLNNQKDELNEQKGYTSGYGKYEISSTQGLEKSLQGKIIEPLKATIGALAQGEIITSIIVTDVEESIEENIFTDSFTIKINSNYSAKISIEYECSAEGKINYDTIKYSSEEVERL